MDVLFLCTGNICRSPMAEGLLRWELERRGVPGRVHSAGLLDDGRPASEHGVNILTEQGIDMTGHQSRRMQREMLDQADLVLGMAREHVREAVVLHNPTWLKGFTLKEFVRRAEEVGARGDEPFDEWVAKVHAGRDRRDLLGWGGDDDVEDPYGMSRGAYEKTYAELQDLVGRLAAMGWGPAE